MATAIINEPIIKKTASLIKEDATPSEVSIPNTTCIIKVKIATAGSGIVSLIISIRAIMTIINVLCPYDDKPSGDGK